MQGSTQIRSTHNVRVDQPAQHVADYFATPPGTPPTIRSRGGEESIASIGSARLEVCSHKTKRGLVAIKYKTEATSRTPEVEEVKLKTCGASQA